MKILQEPNGWVMSRYGKIFSEMPYGPNPRLHRYILTIPSDDGNMLLYNGITKELVKFEQGIDDLFDKKFFDTIWFVPDEFDEAFLAMDIKERLANNRKKVWKPSGYTILTTTDCNARCFYCYEKGILKKNMSDKTAEDVADYIIKNYKKNNDENSGSTGNKVNLSWFGGEPLFNKRVIDIITSKLKSNGVPYSSSMISNGYLFDEGTISTAKTKWNLRSVQITIDGTNDYYKRAKNYIYDDENPLETVLGNILNLSMNGIRVTIRVNVGYYNCEDISKLVDIIADRFKGNKNVSMYIHALFDHGGVTDITDDEKDEKVFTEMSKIDDKIRELGLGNIHPIDNSIKSTHCMADNCRHAVIQCNGNITLCEHYVDSQKYTSIYSDEKDEEIAEKFRKVALPFNRCYFCPLIMDCSFLEMCEDNEGDCSAIRQNYRINNKIAGIKLLEEQKEKQEQKNS